MNQTNDVAQKVIAKIMTGKVKMKPKVLFAFQTAVLVLLAGVAMVLAVFLTSFIGFALKVKGYSHFLIAIILAVVLFIVLAWVLTKRFPAFYKRPLLLGLVIIFISVAMVSLAVFSTPLHQKIMEYVQQNNVPIVTPFYECGCGCSTNHICGSPKASDISPQPSCGCSGDSSTGGSCTVK
ncbi:MAG: hypothetical protein NTV62_00215 [Candidatus Gribaldobacteria bacterium]|nr:hypothetical protein [Candidatus Gribaldobacteria bacterium]